MNKNKYVKVKIINLREHMGTPPVFCEVRIAHFFSFLFCDFCFVCRRTVWLLCTQCCQRLWIATHKAFKKWRSVQLSTCMMKDVGRSDKQLINGR
jgi:hypothetical protein